MINGFAYIVFQEDEPIFVCLDESDCLACIEFCKKENSTFNYCYNRVPIFSEGSNK